MTRSRRRSTSPPWRRSGSGWGPGWKRAAAAPARAARRRRCRLRARLRQRGQRGSPPLRPTATLAHNLGFVLAAALVAVLAWRGVQTADAVVANNEDVRRSLELVSAVKSVRSSLLDVETGARGFVLTGRDAYLDPYRSGRAQWEREYGQLARLLQGRQPSRDAWLRELHET